MKKHLVLGSRGQVGQYVVNNILDAGDQCTEWDITISPDHDLRSGSKKLIEAMQDCDFVHFLASDVGGSKYLAAKQNSFEFIQNNVLLMDNVFSALKLTKKPFYYTSSQMSTMGHSAYGKLKAVGECYTKSLGGTIVWFWNVYGLETDSTKSHVISDFIKMARDDKKILCRTNGKEQRQFVYGKDIAKVLVEISYDPPKRGLTPIHLTNNEWVSIADVAKLVAKFFKGTEIYFTDKEDNVQGIYNDPYLPDVKRYGQEFRSLADGIADMLKVT